MDGLKFIAIIIGIAMISTGLREIQVSRTAATEAAALDLADVENDRTLSNRHVKFGKHIAVFPRSLYSYSKSIRDKSAPTEKTFIEYSYYPIISMKHSFVAKIAELREKYQELENVPAAEPVPEVHRFAVLVKTWRFKTVGEIPEGYSPEKSVQGVIVDAVEELDEDERSLIRESFPEIDLKDVLILHEGRKPATLYTSTITLLAGILLVLGGVVSFFWRRKK